LPFKVYRTFIHSILFDHGILSCHQLFKCLCLENNPLWCRYFMLLLQAIPRHCVHFSYSAIVVVVRWHTLYKLARSGNCFSYKIGLPERYQKNAVISESNHTHDAPGQSKGSVVKALHCKPLGHRFESNWYLCLYDMFPLGIPLKLTNSNSIHHPWCWAFAIKNMAAVIYCTVAKNWLQL